MELYNGRPEDTSGRKEKEIKVYDILDSLHIPYIRADHEAVMTMEACEEIDKALGMEICKNLFLCNRKKTSYYLLLMPGNKALKTKELSQQIPTTRLSFASGEDMETYLNVTPGSATVMGLIFDPENKVQLLVDEELLEQEEFGCHPCVNTSSIKMKTADVFDKFLKEKDKMVKIPFSEREVHYACHKKIGIAVSTLGASRAVALGAYSFALSQLNIL